jgi:beta-glucanase (GH16 family)
MTLIDLKSRSPLTTHFFRLISRLAVFGIILTMTACGGGGGGSSTPTQPTQPTESQVATPTISMKAAQNGAQIVSMAVSTSGANIYYTLDGTTPTATSTQYFAPVLVASNVTVNAIGVLSGDTNSAVATQAVTTGNIPSGTLIWSDEFTNSGTSNIQPDATVWTYDTGAGGWGNAELETYCAWGSTTAPCTTSSPNAYVGTDGYLHIVAQNPSAGVYTSARMKTQGMFSFQYGRLEFRAMVPEAQGFWPAVWLLGSNINVSPWPACGEQDVLERVNAAGWNDPNGDWNEGSVHGTGFTGSNLGTQYTFPSGETAAQWHTYGMIWAPGSVKYYVDDPANIYATYTPSSLTGLVGAKWPFDGGQANFIIINLAIGGSWPGSPDSTTPFPSEMLVDYVRVYTN